MPVNPHIKGGPDVPVTDGGTGASDASSGLSNLGGLDSAAHAVVNHAGIPGVGDLTVAAHSSTDHTGISGVGGDAETESVTVGTGLSQTRSVPGGTLAATNDRLEFKAWGEDPGGGATITVTFGGQTILTFVNVGSGDTWTVRGTIIRTGATTQETGVDSGSAGNVGEHQRTAGTATLSSANSLTVTSDDGDVFALIVNKWAA